MDNDSEKHPVRDSANESIRPGFLGGKGGGETPAEGKIDLSRDDAAKELSENEQAAAKAPSATGGLGAGLAAGAKIAEKGAGLYSGKGIAIDAAKSGLNKLNGLKILKGSAGLGILLVILIAGFVVVGNPLSLIAGMDYNLRCSAQFCYTAMVLEDEVPYVTGDELKQGRVPAGYAERLAQAGIQVGQVTAAGDFVPTNKYIANVDELNEIAAIGSGFYINSAEGELAVLFNNEVVSADDFVATVNSNPEMYMALEKGADITARFYHGDKVNKIFKTLGLNRDAFASWEPSGDAKQDQENFNKILKSVLDGTEGKDELTLDGGYDCGEDEDGDGTGSCSDVNLTGDALDIIGDFKKKNESGAQLLSTAVAASERSKSMRAYTAITSNLERAKIGDNGPVNETMNVIYDDSIEVTYTDANTDEETTVGLSMAESLNFAAAASDGEFSEEEAANFSLDNTLVATEVDDPDGIKKAEVTTNGGNQVKIGVGILGDEVDLNKAESSVQISLTDTNSNLYTSVVGGNRVPSGGFDLNNVINQHNGFGLPADESMVIAYNKDVQKIIAKRAEMERATKSPFDVSSPNTFMGGIVHGMANIMIRNRVASSSVVSTLGTVVGYAGDSVSGLFDGAVADGYGSNLLTSFGEDCQTVPSANSAAAGLWCGQTNVIYTGLMDKGADFWEEWKSNKKNSKLYEEYVKNIADKWSIVGRGDVEICKKNLPDGVVVDLISGLFGACSALGDDGIATGSKYVLSDDNDEAKAVSAYALYDTVSSLLNESKTQAELILEEYYAEHPMDNSEVGIIARLSGMTREQTEVAFAYADYLNEIVAYDASDRYVFSDVKIEIPEKDVLVEHSEKINGDLYCFWRGRSEYGDIRNRNFA